MVGKEFQELFFLFGQVVTHDPVQLVLRKLHDVVILKEQVHRTVDEVFLQVAVGVPKHVIRTQITLAEFDDKLDDCAGHGVGEQLIDQAVLFDLVEGDAAHLLEDLQRPDQRDVVVRTEVDDTVFIGSSSQDRRHAEFRVIFQEVEERFFRGCLHQAPVGTEKLVRILAVDGDLRVLAVPFQDFVVKDAEFFPGIAFRADQAHRAFKCLLAEPIEGFDEFLGLVAIHHDELRTGDRLIAQVGRRELDPGFRALEKNARHGHDSFINSSIDNGDRKIQHADHAFKANITGLCRAFLNGDLQFSGFRFDEFEPVIGNTADLERILAFRNILCPVNTVEGFDLIKIIEKPFIGRLDQIDEPAGNASVAFRTVFERGDECRLAGILLRQLIFLPVFVDQVHLDLRNIIVPCHIFDFFFDGIDKVREPQTRRCREFRYVVAIYHNGNRNVTGRTLLASGRRVHIAGGIVRRHDAKGDKAEDHRDCQHNADDTFSHCVTPFVCLTCSVMRMTHMS